MFFKRKKQRQKTIEELARDGDAEAQYELGMNFYKSGSGENSSAYRDAVLWLEKAAEGGCKKAYNTLGEIYKWGGYGVQEDRKKAADCYLKAYNFFDGEEKGEIENSLGFCYFSLGEEENALVWARRYAERGGDFAVGLYGAMLYDCERYGEAFEVLKRIDENCGDYTVYTLGKCYFYGRGVAENKDEAKRLWQIAANDGNEDAQAALEKYFNFK